MGWAMSMAVPVGPVAGESKSDALLLVGACPGRLDAVAVGVLESD